MSEKLKSAEMILVPLVSSVLKALAPSDAKISMSVLDCPVPLVKSASTHLDLSSVTKFALKDLLHVNQTVTSTGFVAAYLAISVTVIRACW